jgi:hypothetical protein
MAPPSPRRHALEAGWPNPLPTDRTFDRRQLAGSCKWRISTFRRPVRPSFTVVSLLQTIPIFLIPPFGHATAEQPERAPGRRFSILQSRRGGGEPACRRRNVHSMSPKRPGSARRLCGARSPDRPIQSKGGGRRPVAPTGAGMRTDRLRCGRRVPGGLPDPTNEPTERRGARRRPVRLPTRFTERRLT